MEDMEAEQAKALNFTVSPEIMRRTVLEDLTYEMLCAETRPAIQEQVNREFQEIINNWPQV